MSKLFNSFFEPNSLVFPDRLKEVYDRVVVPCLDKCYAAMPYREGRNPTLYASIQCRRRSQLILRL
ncbi:MAG: hypothetical protein QNJ54_24805 [Prochloraceae cyanobacterium]|nr:hypothetical protein [Prochloraceae cyanobacterium]